MIFFFHIVFCNIYFEVYATNTISAVLQFQIRKLNAIYAMHQRACK